MPAMHERTTYVELPPPPLPEFYTSRTQQKEASSASTSTTTCEDEADGETLVTKELSISVDGTYDYEPRVSASAPPPPTTFMMMPPPPPFRVDCPDPAPLAIYHVCRVCLRPRSPRYHREHPIPLDGAPPPPGICRRCRVTNVEDTQNFDLVYESRSNPVKLGFFTPFMRDDIVSQEEMRKMKIDEYLLGRSTDRVTGQRSDIVQEKSRGLDRAKSRGRSDGRRDVEYRHIEITRELSANVKPADVKLEKRRMVHRSLDEAKDAPVESHAGPAPSKPKTRGTSMRVEPTERPALGTSHSRTRSETRISISTVPAPASSSSSASSSAYSSKSSSTERAPPQTTERAPVPGMIEAEVRRVAREEVERQVNTLQNSARSEADIRRIATEEIGRYRAVERKMDAHREAFAYGRLVPVVPEERRIETERDTPADMPWLSPPRDEEAKIGMSTKGSTRKASICGSEARQVEVDVSVHSKSTGKAEAEAPPAPASIRSYKSQTKRSSVRESEIDQGPGWHEETSWGFDDLKQDSFRESEAPPSRVKALSPIAEQEDGSPSKASTHDKDARSDRESWGPTWRRRISIERRRSEADNSEAANNGHTKPSKVASGAAEDDTGSLRLRKNDEETEGSTPRWYSASYRRSDLGNDSVSKSDHDKDRYEKEVDVRYVHYRERNRPIEKSRKGPVDEAPPTDPSRPSRTRRNEGELRKTEPSQRYEESRRDDVSPPRSPNERLSTAQSDKTRWVEDGAAQSSFNEDTRSIGSRAQTGSATPYPSRNVQRNYDSTPSPEPKEKRRSAKATRKDRDSDVDYIYTERIVTPLDKPRGWRPKHLKTVEEGVIYKRADDRGAPQ